jgi:hypothetical protein
MEFCESHLVFECGFLSSKGVWSVHGVLALGMGLGCIFVRVCDSGDEMVYIRKRYI